MRTVQTQFLDLQKMLAVVQENSNFPSVHSSQPQEVIAVYCDATESAQSLAEPTACVALSSRDLDGAPSTALSSTAMQRIDDATAPKILLVEDNQINQMLAQEVLVGKAWKCEIATNGIEALDAIGTKAFDLILMDCQMPIMDGFSATREIRKRQLDGRVTHRCPIIAVTANALKGDRQKCLEAGMDDYLAKPFNPNQLTEIIEQWLPAEPPTKSADSGDDSGDDRPIGDEATPFVRKEFLERCMGDLSFAESLLESFQADSLARVEEIVMHARQRNAVAAGQAAHTLKGMAGILAAHPLQSIAAEIEQAGRDEHLDEIVDLIDDLQNEVARCVAYIPSLTQPELESA
ncbi:response regulator [Rosistilla carotiformis]|uniref:response regulator n=1 Tax=Rosistilla carotiformis TaxID=2528017 RepID=UPI0021BCB4DC|nr:response regulator [Rosistilla carotiformis]